VDRVSVELKSPARMTLLDLSLLSILLSLLMVVLVPIRSLGK
jgi:hypothetical protein